MPVNYGSDLSCTLRSVALPYPDGSTRVVTCVQPAMNMSEVSGRACLAEGLVRRITSARGTLIDVVIPSTTANYGTDVTVNVNADLTARALGMIGADVDAELRKDERVVTSTTAATYIPGAPGSVGLLLLSIDVTDGAGPFKLVLSVSQVTVTILSAPQ